MDPILKALEYSAKNFDFPEKSQSYQDYRTNYQRDLGRIIHSAAFRRLQTKTLVMGASEGDFHRTRLTHSLEVGQTGRGICAHLENQYQNQSKLAQYIPSQYLIEAICYAHDIGHPPFGHGGEAALHRKMADYGGFEGNAQTIRQLAHLEQYYRGEGIRPTRRLILGVLKYPAHYDMFDKKKYVHKPPKCYYSEDAAFIQNALAIFEDSDIQEFCKIGAKGKTLYKSFDASIMELADDISYGIYDVEDAIERKVLRRLDFKDCFLDKCAELDIKALVYLDVQKVADYLFDDVYNRKYAISALIGYFIQSSFIEVQDIFTSPYLDLQAQLTPEARGLLDFFQTDIGWKKVIIRPEIQTLEFKGQKFVSDIFEALWQRPIQLIGREYFERYMGLEDIIPLVEKNGEKWSAHLDATKRSLFARAICDFVAQKSDLMAERYYKRLFVPDFGNSTDEL
ncbi:MAG: anti-phage deoxyguanosine triphosphatase [Alphaproteobacteria bacterium]